MKTDFGLVEIGSKILASRKSYDPMTGENFKPEMCKIMKIENIGKNSCDVWLQPENGNGNTFVLRKKITTKINTLE